jgi:hypothetical protein
VRQGKVVVGAVGIGRIQQRHGPGNQVKERRRKIMGHSYERIAAVIFGLGLTVGATGRAQTAETLPDYVPLLPQVAIR